jgi:monoterpene epsilon-lactone hydrolase
LPHFDPPHMNRNQPCDDLTDGVRRLTGGPSWQARVFSGLIKAALRRRRWGRDEWAVTRRARRVFGAPAPYAAWAARGLRRETVAAEGVRGEWLTPPSPQPGTILYIHGGGFVSCSPATHRPISAALARLADRRVFSVSYRLAPEHRLPAALEDVVRAYDWLSAGPHGPIVLAGDSAGGNLVLALACRVRDGGRKAPVALVAFSPWTDLAGRGASVRGNDGRCAMFRPESIRDFAAAAVGRQPLDDPDTSPAYADLSRLPPVLLHVGSTELLLDDSVTVHARIRASGGRSELTVYDDVPHCWQMLAPLVPESTHSLRASAAFITRHLDEAA